MGIATVGLLCRLAAMPTLNHAAFPPGAVDQASHVSHGPPDTSSRRFADRLQPPPPQAALSSQPPPPPQPPPSDSIHASQADWVGSLAQWSVPDHDGPLPDAPVRIDRGASGEAVDQWLSNHRSCWAEPEAAGSVLHVAPPAAPLLWIHPCVHAQSTPHTRARKHALHW